MFVRKIGETLELTKLIVHRIVTEELQMWKICYKMALQNDPIPDKTQRRNAYPTTAQPHSVFV